MKFGKPYERYRKTQTFDREKITTTKCGETYNTYDAIQAANVDTDINEVIAKYHLQADKAKEFMEQKGGMKGIYADFTEIQENIQSPADILKIKERADETFYKLPTDIRKAYGNDKEKFFEDLSKPEAQRKFINNYVEKLKPQTKGEQVNEQ